MRSKNRFPKKVYSVSLTPEAWVIVGQKADLAGQSRSSYIENLIRRGDTSLYDTFISFLIDYYLKTGLDIETIKQGIQVLETEQKTIRQFLIQVGISPNQLPD